MAASWAGSSLQLLFVIVANPARTVQFEHRISQHIGNTDLRQRRSNGPEEHMFGSGSRDDEPADANIVTGLDSHPSREVDGLRRGRRTVGVGRCGVAVGGVDVGGRRLGC